MNLHTHNLVYLYLRAEQSTLICFSEFVICNLVASIETLWFSVTFFIVKVNKNFATNMNRNFTGVKRKMLLL